jgi:hypothetical protein
MIHPRLRALTDGGCLPDRFLHGCSEAAVRGFEKMSGFEIFFPVLSKSRKKVAALSNHQIKRRGSGWYRSRIFPLPVICSRSVTNIGFFAAKSGRSCTAPWTI